MPDQQSTGLLGLPPTVWLALIVGLAGVFALSQKPFQDTRPPSSVLPLEHGSLNDGQNVEARLWEDPLSAVALARKSTEPPAAYEPHHLQEKIQECRQNKFQTLVLGVMINGAPYTDDIETRRRTRYAVLAGLYRSGFVPANHDRIGYLFTETTVQVFAFGQRPPNAEPAHDIAAFEWHERDQLVSPHAAPATPASETGQVSRATYESCHSDHVLLLWFDQEGFRKQPIQKLSEILKFIVGGIDSRAGGEDSRVTLAILGPADSDGLRAMYDEAGPTNWASGLLPMSFYSSQATASDLVLNVDGSNNKTFTEQLNSPDGTIRFFRTVTDDEQVAQEVVSELKQRGIANNEIALVAERDTLYARGMGGYFGGCRNPPGTDPSWPSDRSAPNPSQPDTAQHKPARRGTVRCFTYLKGLDGLVPTAANPTGSTPATAPKTADSSAAEGAPTDTSDAAIGPSQLDSLRRLADEIAAIRSTTPRTPRATSQIPSQAAPPPLPPIKAIGVISSDVYDKLLVLQALRGALPNLTYFTFDLDARLLEQRNLKWTRQLLVGSSLGLSLRPRLQGDIPPFRDTYQTSAFFATLFAVHRFVKPSGPNESLDAGLRWTKQPRIFEIGRTQAFDLMGEPPDEHCNFDGDCPYIAAVRHVWLWNRPVSRMQFQPRVIAVVLSVLCLAAITVALGTRGIAGKSREHKIPFLDTRRRSNLKGSLLLVAAIAIVTFIAWPWVVDWITQCGTRVPTPLFGGANQWTPRIVDLTAILVVLVLVVRGQRKLHDNAESLRREFGFGKSRRELIRWHRAQLKPRRLRQRGLALFWFPLRPLPRQTGIALATGDVSPIEAIIAQYLDRGTAFARLARVFCVTVVVVLLLWGAEWILGVTILRLSAMERTEWISLVSLFATQFLTLWAADALFLSRSFLLALWRDQPAWPKEALQKECDKSCLPKDRAVLWLDLQLIARRTRGVASLVWYPSFVIAALTIAALTLQFREFKFANNPVALLAGALFVVVSAVALRRAAEAWRAGVTRRLEDDRLCETAGPNDRSSNQLDRLLDRVSALHEGAFAPYSEQPIVRAVLVPALTYAATVGLQYAHIGLG